MYVNCRRDLNCIIGFRRQVRVDKKRQFAEKIIGNINVLKDRNISKYLYILNDLSFKYL